MKNEITAPRKDLELTAMAPQEMIESQTQLIGWCQQKLDILRAEETEIKESYEHAKKMKWKSATLQRLYLAMGKRILYYEKIKSALDHGYHIVPNFPIQMFAIRTKRNPDTMISGWGNDHQQDSQTLPINAGEYQNPFPIVSQHTVKHADGREVIRTRAEDWDDFEFPITMAKPVIMKATSYAMALKIFDQIGIMPAHKKEDPVIIGQVKLRECAYKTKLVSFMIAWHLNANVL